MKKNIKEEKLFDMNGMSVSFIYSFSVFPNKDFSKLAIKEWKEIFNDKEKWDAGIGHVIEPKIELVTSTEFGNRHGFDPILNSSGPGPEQIWFFEVLESIKIMASEKIVIKVDHTSYLLRLWEDGAASLTITLKFDRPLMSNEIFLILDLAREENEKSPKIYIPSNLGKKKNICSLYNVFKMLFCKIITPLIKKDILQLLSSIYPEVSYQCPYVFTNMSLNEKNYKSNFPWVSAQSEININLRPQYCYSAWNEPNVEQKKIAALLLRPMIWPEYIQKANILFENFLVPDEVFDFQLGQFKENYFWDKRGIVLFHARSSIFINCFENVNELVVRTWRSLLDILESIRARWHLYIDLNSRLDEIATRIEDKNIINTIVDRREQFIRSMNYALPYSQTATHLVELAKAAENGFLLNDLYSLTLRKFESINWLYGDRLERRRVTIFD